MGHKIGHAVEYDEQLLLQPFMSEGQFGPRYTLYGVICHAGGGPNSGHYYAFVKSRENKWYEMNDESVTPLGSPPVRKNAYILFYLKNKGQKLDSVTFSSVQRPKSNLAAAMKKRTREQAEDEDQGEKVSRPFIGPVLPSATSDGVSVSPSEAKRPKLDNGDPQANRLKRKIRDATAHAALSELADYASDDDEPPKEESSKPSTIIRPQPATATPSDTPKSSTIPPDNFYGRPSNSKKREGPSPARHTPWKKNSLSSTNPFNRIGIGRRNKGMARGI